LHRRPETQAVNEQLTYARTSRIVIEQAKGMALDAPVPQAA